MQQIDCKVDTKASGNILSLYKAQALFEKELLEEELRPLTGRIEASGDNPVTNLGSCRVYLHSASKTYSVYARSLIQKPI